MPEMQSQLQQSGYQLQIKLLVPIHPGTDVSRDGFSFQAIIF
jgi:hypothetical protein